MNQVKQVLLDAEGVGRTVSRMAHEIVERNGGTDGLALIGIRSRGAYLAGRIAKKIAALTDVSLPAGAIDVSPYRDDHKRREAAPLDSSRVPVSIDEKTVVLIDDVIYTGRTVRAALDLLSDLGKPKKIVVAILVDRGERELPIKADIVGKNVEVAHSERINVFLEEMDGIDQVTVGPGPRG